MNEWHNPDPKSLGEVISETKSGDGRSKVIIIRHKSGNYMVHGYYLDDSDLLEGHSDSVGWVSESGPSIVDTFSRAEILAIEYLTRGQQINEE